MLVVFLDTSIEKPNRFIGWRQTRVLLSNQIDMWQPFSRITQFRNFEKDS